MAAGDWAPGTRMTNMLAQIVLDDGGRVVHCGLGYHLASASGRVLSTASGHTWGGPDQQPPEPFRSALQDLMDVLRQEAVESEGLTSLSS